MITIGSKIVLKEKYRNSYPVLHRKEPFTVIDFAKGEYKVAEGYWIAEEFMEDMFLSNLDKILT